MVQHAIVEGEEEGLLFLDIVYAQLRVVFHGHIVAPVGADVLPVVHCIRVADSSDSVPVEDDSGLGVRELLTQNGVDGGRNSMAVVGCGGNGALGGVPFVESVHLGGHAHEHSGPVDGGCGRHYGTFC